MEFFLSIIEILISRIINCLNLQKMYKRLERIEKVFCSKSYPKTLFLQKSQRLNFKSTEIDLGN
jgi:hypothetical protein